MVSGLKGGRAAALLLVGVLIGGVSGGAAATYLTYRATQSPDRSPPPSVGLPIATAPPPSIGTADEEIVGVVQDLLPSVVTVINYAANRQPQSSGSGFVVDSAKGYVVTNNHVVEDPRTPGAGSGDRRGPPAVEPLFKNRPGDKVKLTLIRTGKEMTVDVTLGQPPQ